MHRSYLERQPQHLLRRPIFQVRIEILVLKPSIIHCGRIGQRGSGAFPNLDL